MPKSNSVVDWLSTLPQNEPDCKALVIRVVTEMTREAHKCRNPESLPTVLQLSQKTGISIPHLYTTTFRLQRDGVLGRTRIGRAYHYHVMPDWLS